MDNKKIDFSRKYTGYLWMSDSANPMVLTEPGTVSSALFEKMNPFVAEGQLYDSENDVSVSIRYADGKYFINCYENAKGADDDLTEDVEYCSVRMAPGLKLKFRRRWKLEQDPNCEDMEAPSVESEVFIGFTAEEEGWHEHD